MAPKVLALVGSIVTPCGVHRLTRVAAEGATRAGAEVREVQLLGLDLPLFSFDREAADGLPTAALELKAAIEWSDGLLVGAPELNTGITGVLKNALDWASRPATAGGPRNESFAGALAAMVSGSKWDHAGIRGLAQLRGTLAGLGCLVIPEELSVPHAPPRFRADGSLPDEELAAKLHALGSALVTAIEARG